MVETDKIKSTEVHNPRASVVRQMARRARALERVVSRVVCSGWGLLHAIDCVVLGLHAHD